MKKERNRKLKLRSVEELLTILIKLQGAMIVKESSTISAIIQLNNMGIKKEDVFFILDVSENSFNNAKSFAKKQQRFWRE